MALPLVLTRAKGRMGLVRGDEEGRRGEEMKKEKKEEEKDHRKKQTRIDDSVEKSQRAKGKSKEEGMKGRDGGGTKSDKKVVTRDKSSMDEGGDKSEEPCRKKRNVERVMKSKKKGQNRQK